jgi:nicotinamide mononucleotide adenylyltransferase
MRYSFYIGRFQPFHDGHEWCVRQMLSKGKKVCIAIMNMEGIEGKNNPYTYRAVFNTIVSRFVNELNVGDIEIVEIPPIESVNYGRDVGYDFNELVPPEHIKKISGHKIRNEDDTVI